MNARQLAACADRLQEFLTTMLAGLGRAERRRHGSLYVQGLRLDGKAYRLNPWPGATVRVLELIHSFLRVNRSNSPPHSAPTHGNISDSEPITAPLPGLFSALMAVDSFTPAPIRAPARPSTHFCLVIGWAVRTVSESIGVRPTPPLRLMERLLPPTQQLRALASGP